MKATQADRLLAYLKDNPGVTSLDIITACRIVNATGRISDLRARGLRIDCRKGSDKLDRYWLVKPQRQPIKATLHRAFNIGDPPHDSPVYADYSGSQGGLW